MKINKKMKQVVVVTTLMLVGCTGTSVFASETGKSDEPEIIVTDETADVENQQDHEDYVQRFIDRYGALYDSAGRIPYIQAKNSDEIVYFEYDENGNHMRTISGDHCIKLEFGDDFVWGAKVVAREKDGVRATFFYDEFEQCVGMEYNGDYYYLRYNKPGHVSGVENASHELIAKYEYDENLNCTVYGKDEHGEWTDQINDPAFVGLQNPMRAFGAYYDELSGYYLMGGGMCYDVGKGEYIRDEAILQQIQEQVCSEDTTDIDRAATTTPADIDQQVQDLMDNPAYGQFIPYQEEAAWCNSLNKQEVLARMIYAECVVVGEHSAVTWEVLNRKAANWSGFYGDGRSNTLKNIATCTNQYDTLYGKEKNTKNARQPDTKDTRWRCACALCAQPYRNKLGSLLSKPSGFNKQCCHVGMVYYDKFSGTTASTLKYNTHPVRDVMIVGVNTNITSSATIQSYKNQYSNRNIFYNNSEDYPSKYDFT